MTTATDSAHAWSRANGDAFLEELKAFLRIPSLSGSPDRAGDVAAAAK